MTISNRGKILAAAALPLALLVAGPAKGQEQAGPRDEPAAAAIGEVLVRGIRGSLMRALDVKRGRDAVVDAIDSEDIGKFPDKNVADSLQRIPGISVDRGWGEGRDIFIRGTDKDVNRTLMNGQNVASAYWWANDNPSRGFNYSILASELVSRLEVRKSPEADQDEGSLGGAVDVLTRRPMDLEAGTFHASLENMRSELPDAWDPQFGALASWKNGAETFAALASFSSQNRAMRRDGLEAFPTNTLYDVRDRGGDVIGDVYAVWGGGSAIFRQQRERETRNLTLQWRPARRWDLVFNTVQSALEMDNSSQNYLFLLGGSKLEGGDSVTNPRFIATADGRRALTGGIIENPRSPGAAIESIFRDASIESAVHDLDINYAGDGWLAQLQTGFTSAEGGSDRDQNYWFEGNTRYALNLTRDRVEVDYLDLDAADAAALALNPGKLRDWSRNMEDDEFYLQGDVELAMAGWIHSLAFGAKWRDHTVQNNRRVGSAAPHHPRFSDFASITLADVSAGLTPALHGETASSGSITRYAWVDEGRAAAVIDPILADGVMVYRYDQNAHFEINEQIAAVYAKAGFEGERLRGNFGIRAVTTSQTSNAFRDGGIASVNRRYTDVLPSANFAYSPRDNLIIRGALARAMARPTFTNLSANLLIDATTQTASGGNPELAPTYSNQFELGVEWYFADAALLSATYFNKDLSTYIVTRTEVDSVNGRALNITRPFNADGAEIQGVELQWLQELGAGFGVVANYTWTDGRLASEVGDFELPGNSKDQMNASLYYEDDRFSIRLSHNYRSESFGDLVSGSQRVIDDFGQWDATFNWAAGETIDVFLTAVNIGNEILRQTTSDGIPGWGFYENGPRHSIGVRVRFQ